MRMEMDSMPVELDELERRRIQLEIEREALRKEKDDASRARLEALERELADVAERATALKSRWEQEKGAIGGLRETKSELEALQVEIDAAERAAEYARVAELRYGRQVELQQRLREQEEALARKESDTTDRLLKEEVDADDIARIVASWTGIPVTRLMEGEQQKLVHMEERLHERVVGQDEAIEAVSRCRPARPGRAARPAPAHRLVHLPGPHGCGQDRARPRARLVPVRRRPGDDPHRHERVHGEVRRVSGSSARRPGTWATRRAAS